MEEDVLERAKKKMVLEYASEWFFLSARGREGYGTDPDPSCSY